MKNLLIGVFLLATAPLVFSETKPDTQVIVRPLPLSVTSECTDLATGFATAFTRLHHVPFHVKLQRGEGEILVLNDVKTVSAVGATLLLETGKGFVYVINPRDVVWFSDAAVVGEKPAANLDK